MPLRWLLIVFGLPDDFDGSFLVDRSLLQVSIGLHEVIFRFDEDVEITVEGEFKVVVGNEGQVFRSPVEGGAASLALLQEVVSDVRGTTNGTLTLTFPSSVLEIYDTSPRYESYQVRNGEQLYVV